MRHDCGADKPCRSCERIAEARAQRDDVEQSDRYGATPDYSWPRGYGGVR